jgi:hypothetical protein
MLPCAARDTAAAARDPAGRRMPALPPRFAVRSVAWQPPQAA